MKNQATIIKIISLIALSFIILNIKNLYVLTLFFFVLFLAFQFLKEKNKLNQRLIALMPIAIIIFSLQLIFYKQLSLMSKIIFSYLVFSKLAIISMIVLLFVTITSPSEIILAFWFLPDDLKTILTMTFYFIPVIFDEVKYIIIIQKSRGLNSFWTNPFPLIVPLLHRVMKRAEALSLTIASRGYNNH